MWLPIGFEGRERGPQPGFEAGVQLKPFGEVEDHGVIRKMRGIGRCTSGI